MEYKATLHACYRGYFVQAIINNLPPLLFTTFLALYGIPVEQLALLILLNFGTQIVADVCSVFFIDKIGMRASAIIAHACAFAGLWLMAFLPGLLHSPFLGLALAMILCAWGGGILEVLVSPIVDLIPGDAKAAGMSLLHSFYCWGQVCVVLFTTLLLYFIRRENWMLLPLLWSVLALYNLVRFARVKMPPPRPAEHTVPFKGLLRKRLFWLGMVLMIAAGASELGMSQWSSAFAEAGLGVNKVMGDLLGPFLFGIFMALGRTWYGLFGAKIPLRPVMMGCAVLGVACYLTAALAPWPLLALAGCALCGLAVSMFWPGVFSLCSETLRGGTAMFGVFAIMGDIGCSIGPWMVGAVAGAAGGTQYLSIGLLAATIFPAIMLVGVAFMRLPKKHEVL